MSNADASFALLDTSTSELIFGHVVGSDTVAITLDLDRIADGAQLGAWAHNLAVPIANGVAGRLRVRSWRTVSVDPTLDPDLIRGGQAVAVLITGEDYTLLRVLDRSLSNTRYAYLADVYEETRFSGLRETARVEQAERNLRDAFRIEPALIIPESDADQDWLREQITADPLLSSRSLQGWVVGFGKGSTPVVDRLLGLCNLFPYDVASRLSARDRKSPTPSSKSP